MKKILLLLCAVQCSLFDAMAQGRDKYEFMRNLPVYVDSLIADLTYPLAWGNSEIKDFDEWKKAGDEKTVLKIKEILRDIAEHPYSGIGKP